MSVFDPSPDPSKSIPYGLKKRQWKSKKGERPEHGYPRPKIRVSSRSKDFLVKIGHPLGQTHTQMFNRCSEIRFLQIAKVQHFVVLFST